MSEYAEMRKRVVDRMHRAIRKNGAPMTIVALASAALGWDYKVDACRFVGVIADEGDLVRSWDEPGEVYYSIPGEPLPSGLVLSWDDAYGAVSK